MSQSPAHSHEHDHDHDGHAQDEGYHATAGGYAVGFLLSVLLTAIPFWLVMGKVINSSTMTAFVVLAFAVVQIVVHMIYFLHMDTKSQGGWNMLALIFTMVLVVITLAGSLWVMFHLNSNMMPMPSHSMPMPMPMENMVHNMNDMP